MVKVLIIGAGNTGESIVENLSPLRKVSKIFLFNRSFESSEFLSKKLKSKKILPVKNLSSLSNLDFVIVTLSGMSVSSRNVSFRKSKSTYEMRQDELKYNLGAFIEIIPFFRSLSRKTKIIIVTNPVDELSNYLKKILPNKEIFGFGLQLDVKRYSDYLGKEVDCIGLHGKAIPILGLKTDKDYDSLSKKVDSILVSKVRKFGIPHKFAGREFKNYFVKFLSNKKVEIYTSYYLNKEFFGIKGILVALPFYVKKGKIVGIKNLNLSLVEENRLKNEIKELNSSINKIISSHKSLISYK